MDVFLYAQNSPTANPSLPRGGHPQRVLPARSRLSEIHRISSFHRRAPPAQRCAPLKSCSNINNFCIKTKKRSCCHDLFFVGIRQLPILRNGKPRKARFALTVRNGRIASLPLALLPCSLGFRFAYSATGSAQLRPPSQCVSRPACRGLGSQKVGRWQTKNRHRLVSVFCLVSGSYLSSQAVSSSVFSAYKGLTSVFGMGTGGSP